MTRPEHYRSYSAVFPILLREGANGREVLLHLRQNTGYMDGCWDFAGSGHVDENETARQAVARECLEELGITVNPADMEFVHLCHRVAGGDGRTITISASSSGNMTALPPSWSRTKTPDFTGSPRRPFRKIPALPWRSCCAPVCGASLTVRSFMTFRSHQSKKRKSLCLFKR